MEGPRVVFSSSYIITADTGKSSQFTAQEIQLFEKRYENNYDLVHDARYNHWKLIFHGGMLHKVEQIRIQS